MSFAWRFHGIFTSKPDLGTIGQKSIGKMVPITRLQVSVWIFLIFHVVFWSASDSCRFHGTFMQVSCRFLHLEFWVFFLEEKLQINNLQQIKNDHLAWMSDSSQIHLGFMSLSCQFHSSRHLASDSSQIHRGFM